MKGWTEDDEKIRALLREAAHLVRTSESPHNRIATLEEALADAKAEIARLEGMLSPKLIFTLVRIDDHGNEFVIDTYRDYAEARKRLNTLEARGHKQTYLLRCTPGSPTVNDGSNIAAQPTPLPVKAIPIQETDQAHAEEIVRELGKIDVTYSHVRELGKIDVTYSHLSQSKYFYMKRNVVLAGLRSAYVRGVNDERKHALETKDVDDNADK